MGNKNQNIQKALFQVSKSRGRNAALLTNPKTRLEMAETIEWLREDTARRDPHSQYKLKPKASAG